jgi:hypothetical protein
LSTFFAKRIVRDDIYDEREVFFVVAISIWLGTTAGVDTIKLIDEMACEFNGEVQSTRLDAHEKQFN